MLTDALTLAPIESIKIDEERQRKIFNEEELENLCESILRIGLLHPVIVQATIDGKLLLLAGERRFRAMSKLYAEGKIFNCNGKAVPQGYIPATQALTLTEYERREIELDENLVRINLTWQEHAMAVSQLHNLKLAEYGPIDKASPGTGWGLGDTVKLVSGTAIAIRAAGAPTTAVSHMLLLAKHMDKECVSKAKSIPEAMNALRGYMAQSIEMQIVEQLKAEIKTTVAGAVIEGGNIHVLNEDVTLVNVDLVEGFPRLPDSQFDIIITDPPYGIGADAFGDQSKIGHAYEDNFDYAMGLVDTIALEGYRVTRPDAHMFLFSAYENVAIVQSILKTRGWTVWPRPLIWDKCGTGMVPESKFGPRYSYECIIFARKGNRTINSLFNDVLHIPPVPGQKLLHAAQKPVELYQTLLSYVSLPGDSVLDPCAGTGTAGVAAANLGLSAMLFEREDATHNIAYNRLWKGTV